MQKITSIISALAISGLVYLAYRSEKTLVNELASLFLPADRYTTLKSSITQAMPLPDYIVFSLPGGLWVFCATVLAQDFYIQVRDQKIPIALFPIFFAIGLEFCQLTHLTNGRFDIMDIGSYLLFWAVASSVFPSRNTHKNIVSPFTLHGFLCLACFVSVYLAHVSQ